MLWALQNEDANARLVVINTRTHEQKLYLFDGAPHGGGYDDIVFRGCKVYISASNPANNPNTGPAIVSAELEEGGIVHVRPLLAGTSSAFDIPTDATIKLNLQDPDSMTLDPEGNIVLDSQSDQELIFVSNPGAHQRVLHLPLTYLSQGVPTAVEVDDTAFVTSTEGFILFADKGLNKVFALKRNAFVPGEAYTAADGGPFVGTINLASGVITPIVTGLSGPGGLVFVDTTRHRGGGQAESDDWRRESDACRDREGDSR